MREAQSQGVLATAAVVCSFCGAREELPADGAERVRVLRARLAQIRWAAQGEEAPALAISRLLDTWRRNVLPIVVLMGLGITAMSTFSAFVSAGAEGSFSLSRFASALPMPLGTLGAITGLCVGFLYSMHRYAIEVRPSLEADPPLVEGAPIRCRACGGALSSQGGAAFVVCGFCAAHNLVSQDIAVHRRERLDAELSRRQARLAGVRVQTGEAARRYQQRLYLTMGLSVACAWALSAGAAALLGALL